MAADNNRQDLSMEEILSSIRNILLDEGDAPARPAPVEEDIQDLSENDAVFDLSKEMLVETPPVFEYTKIVDSAEDKDIDPISDLDSLIGEDNDLPLDDLKLDAPLSAREQEIATEDEEEDLTAGLVDDLEAGLVDTDANAIEENLAAGLVDSTVEEEPSAPAVQPLLAAPKPAPVIAAPAPQSAPSPKSSVDAASEDILGKFASVFEADQQRKMIEEVVRSEIAGQTHEWLDKNLPSIVTEIVQKEVTRVMARVGK